MSFVTDSGMVGVVLWFVYYMFNKFIDKDETVRKEYFEANKLIADAVQNNTIAITKLLERLGVDDDFTVKNE